MTLFFHLLDLCDVNASITWALSKKTMQERPRFLKMGFIFELRNPIISEYIKTGPILGVYAPVDDS